MKLFIPELGDTLVLSKDWKFRLVIEGRNTKLIEHWFPEFTFTYHWTIPRVFNLPDNMENRHFFLKKEKMRELNNELWEIQKKATRQNWDENQAEFNKKVLDWFDEHKDEVVLPGTADMYPVMPKGTELKLSRIFIRQGAPDYNSVTFYAKIPGVKKAIRFFAKLADVNNMEFDETKTIKAKVKQK